MLLRDLRPEGIDPLAPRQTQSAPDPSLPNHPHITGINIMNAIEVAQRYIDAWNRHDADAIVASFAEGGTYNNPDAGQGLTGEAIADFAKGVFAALPDVSFEIVSIGDSGGGLVAYQWLLRGTNTGPGLDDTPPTGRSVRVPGATFVQVKGDKIRSEYAYYDRQTMAEQLGATATEPA
jgi:steroid delta-isomerase-like uncharacterized protein